MRGEHFLLRKGEIAINSGGEFPECIFSLMIPKWRGLFLTFDVRSVVRLNWCIMWTPQILSDAINSKVTLFFHLWHEYAIETSYRQFEYIWLHRVPGRMAFVLQALAPGCGNTKTLNLVPEVLWVWPTGKLNTSPPVTLLKPCDSSRKNIYCHGPRIRRVVFIPTLIDRFLRTTNTYHTTQYGLSHKSLHLPLLDVTHVQRSCLTKCQYHWRTTPLFSRCPHQCQFQLRSVLPLWVQKLACPGLHLQSCRNPDKEVRDLNT